MACDDLTECFRMHLLDKANEFGFAEPKRTDWVKYMLSSADKDEFFRAVLPKLKLTEQDRNHVLDIGCGYGNLLLSLEKYFKHIHGIEILAERVEWARKRIPGADIVCASAIRLPWPNEWFDLVTSTDVFEHISTTQQKSAADEMFRVTKHGGHGFLKVPNRFQLFDDHNYVRFATWLPHTLRKRYVQLISKNPYVQCWERTGRGWKVLFKNAGFHVVIRPLATKYLLFPCGYHLFLRKHS